MEIIRDTIMLTLWFVVIVNKCFRLLPAYEIYGEIELFIQQLILIILLRLSVQNATKNKQVTPMDIHF